MSPRTARTGEQSPGPGARASGAGLCDTCAHQRVVRNTRGSRFSLCERSRSDPAYPRYPRVPVLSCEGYVPSGEGDVATRSGRRDHQDGSAGAAPVG